MIRTRALVRDKLLDFFREKYSPLCQFGVPDISGRTFDAVDRAIERVDTWRLRAEVKHRLGESWK